MPWSEPPSSAKYDDAFRTEDNALNEQFEVPRKKRRKESKKSFCTDKVRNFVLFKCNDCGRTFCRKPLPSPNSKYVQHICVDKKVQTRRFGNKAKTCTFVHPGLNCIEKVKDQDKIFPSLVLKATGKTKVN